jgi:hypothetical protein
MKLITRSAIAFLFLAAFAFPALAQNPKLASRLGKPSASCFPFTLKNLEPNLLSVSAAYLVVFDQTNCKKTCDFKIAIDKKLKPCEAYTFKICCDHPLPAKYMAYVKIFHAGGSSEDWLWN